jgi:hypothetical protein
VSEEEQFSSCFIPIAGPNRRKDRMTSTHVAPRCWAVCVLPLGGTWFRASGPTVLNIPALNNQVAAIQAIGISSAAF